MKDILEKKRIIFLQPVYFSQNFMQSLTQSSKYGPRTRAHCKNSIPSLQKITCSPSDSVELESIKNTSIKLQSICLVILKAYQVGLSQNKKLKDIRKSLNHIEGFLRFNDIVYICIYIYMHIIFFCLVQFLDFFLIQKCCTISINQVALNLFNVNKEV